MQHKILNASPVSRAQPWPTLLHVLCSTVVLTELDSRHLFLYCFLAWYIMLLSCAMPTTSCLQFYFVNILLTSFAALYNLGRYPRTFFVVCIPYGMVNDLCTTISHQDMLQLGKSVECINTQNVFCTVVNSSLLTWVDNWLSAQCDYQHSPTVLFNLRNDCFVQGTHVQQYSFQLDNSYYHIIKNISTFRNNLTIKEHSQDSGVSIKF